MKLRNVVLLLASHGLVGALGFAAGIYALPILIAPAAPTEAELSAVAESAAYTGEFRRDLEDSDALHWGEGVVSVGARSIGLAGELAPGPDYKLYLSPQFVETEADFRRLKADMVRVGGVRTFRNFLVPVPAGVEVQRFDTVIVWCESFGQFITAAKHGRGIAPPFDRPRVFKNAFHPPRHQKVERQPQQQNQPKYKMSVFGMY